MQLFQYNYVPLQNFIKFKNHYKFSNKSCEPLFDVPLPSPAKDLASSTPLPVLLRNPNVPPQKHVNEAKGLNLLYVKKKQKLGFEESIGSDLSLENLSGKKFDFKVTNKLLVKIGCQDGRGDFPSSICLLKLYQPLIGSNTVARLAVVIQHVNSLRDLRLQFHLSSPSTQQSNGHDSIIKNQRRESNTQQGHKSPKPKPLSKQEKKKKKEDTSSKNVFLLFLIQKIYFFLLYHI